MAEEKDNVSLEHHFEQQLKDIKELLEAKFLSIEQATKLATETLNARLDNMNEFRGAMKDQLATAFTKNEHAFYAEKVEADLRMLRENKALLEGKASQKSVVWAIGISVAGLVIGAIGIIISIAFRTTI